MKIDTNHQELRIIKLHTHTKKNDGVPLALSQTSPDFYVSAVQVF